MDEFSCVVPSWDEIQDLVEKAVGKVKEAGFRPDAIVAISRGGLVPGRLFADHLHIKDVVSVKADHWGITAAKDGKARIAHSTNADLKGKKLLVVDDVTDTGQSMELVLEHLKEFEPAEIKTATAYHLSNSKYVPDFFGAEIPWVWIIFPWNYREDLVNLIGKITDKEEKNLEEIHKDLKEKFKVETRKEKLEDIMKHIQYVKEGEK